MSNKETISADAIASSLNNKSTTLFSSCAIDKQGNVEMGDEEDDGGKGSALRYLVHN